MATQAYRDWVSAGKPYDLATPIDQLRTWAGANNVPLLGTIGNEDHLQANNPQDHTPFSKTAWPVALKGYIVTAIDLGNVRGLGSAIEAGARAGKYPWLKYMNHSGAHLDSRDLDGDGLRWEGYPSSDEHVHLSIRSDWVDRSIGDFDPWGDDDVNAAQDGALAVAYQAADALLDMQETTESGGGKPARPARIVTEIKALRRDVAALVARPPAEIDYGKLAAELIRQLAAN